MARNRKSQSTASRFGPALKALLLCLLIGGSGVGYVWQKEQIARLGEQIRKRELHLRDVERQNKALGEQLATMRTQRYLEMRIKELNLGLVRPQPAQLWTLPEPPRDTPLRPVAEKQYASRAQSAEAMP